MSAYYFNSAPLDDDLIDDLAGWGGDLQSLIEDLKLNGVGKNSSQLKDKARELIKDENTNFGIIDLNSDVDAFNIYKLYGESILLSEIFSSYYSSNYKSRYHTFIDKQGGLDSLEKRSINYTTHGNEFPKHNILNSSAQQAFNKNQKFVKKKVTKDETEALTYAFIQWLKDLR